MIDPPVKAYRRRASELRLSAGRERTNDLDSGALLMFYAAECALKHAYMMRHGLKSASDVRAGKSAAVEFKHDLPRLLMALQIPRSAIPMPAAELPRIAAPCHVHELHQAWRYGEKVDDSSQLFDWLKRITEHCERI